MCANKASLLGIDVGGTWIKALAINENGDIIAQSRIRTESAFVVHVQQNQRKLDLEILWSLVKNSIKQLSEQLPLEYSICALGISAMGCTQFFIDEDGNNLDTHISSKLIEQEFLKYKELFTELDFFNCTGYPLESSLSGIYLSALSHVIDKSKLKYVLTIDEYLNYRFTGTVMKNFSTATSNGLWDTQKSQWLEQFKEISGLEYSTMGVPVESASYVGKIMGDLAQELNLPKDCKIYTAGHDYECAALSCSSLLDNALLNVSGSIELFANFYPQDIDFSFDEHWRIISDHHVIPNYKSCMLETFGSIHFEWVKNSVISDSQWGFDLEWEHCLSEIEKIYKTNPISSELFIPHIFGTFIPKFDSSVNGLFCGLTENTNSIYLFKAVIEGVFFQSKQIVSFFKTKSPNIDRLCMVGGVGRSRVLSQIKSDILNLPIVIPNITEASAFGAALLAGIGHKIYSNYEEATNILSDISTEIIQPNSEISDLYQDIFESYYLPMSLVKYKAPDIINKYKRSRV